MISREIARAELAALLSGATRWLGARRLWMPVPLPVVLPNRQHLQRTVRYVFLNPCRDHLVDGPLSWPWSNYRGVVGASVDPWTRWACLGPVMGWRDLRRFHEYVCSDPTVSEHGRAFPELPPPSDIASAPLAAVIAAADAAVPPWISAQRRHAMGLALARRQGWRNVALVARALGIGRSTAYRLARETDAEALHAAALCLGDARLRFMPRLGGETSRVAM